VNIPSPVSWFWPATVEWTVALPDPRVADRFYTMTLIYGEKQPVVFLVDADCQTRKLIFFGPDEPESAEPARDLFGGPVRPRRSRNEPRGRLSGCHSVRSGQAPVGSDFPCSVRQCNLFPMC